jgi:hypothetical protein
LFVREIQNRLQARQVVYALARVHHRMSLPSETILELRVRAAGGKEASTMIDYGFISESPSLLLPNVQQLGWDLLPGAEEIQASYLDSEGDRCILTERAAADALSFAVSHTDDGNKVLEVQVQDRAEAIKSGCIDCSSCVSLRERLAKVKQEAAEAQTAKVAAEEDLAATCGSLQAEVDAVTKRAQADLKEKSAEVARLLALSETLRAEVAAAMRHSRPQSGDSEILSAAVAESSPLVLGIEASEDSSKRGDASQDFRVDLERLGLEKAYRLGCIRVDDASLESASVPASAKLRLANDGAVRWPETAVLVNVKGDSFGVPLLTLGVKSPGESEEINMDLVVAPPKSQGNQTHSMWAIVNAATGTRFGPLLVLEVDWQLQSAKESNTSTRNAGDSM